MSGTTDSSIAAALERAAAAYDALADHAEEVEDEWQYIEDLRAAYLPAIRGLQPDGSVDEPAAVAAIDELVAEIGLITDPHKAIDWLSTFPHVLALAVGSDVDAVADAEAELEAADGAAPDAAEPPDNPFGFLLRGDR
jgi:hypothetical protein